MSKFENMSPEQYTDFLYNYTIFNKSPEQIARDLDLNTEEAIHIPEAIRALKLQSVERQLKELPSLDNAYFLTEFIEERMEELPPEIKKMLSGDENEAK